MSKISTKNILKKIFKGKSDKEMTKKVKKKKVTKVKKVVKPKTKKVKKVVVKKAKKVLKKIKKYMTKKENVSPTSKYIRAVDKRNKAIQDAFNGNF